MEWGRSSSVKEVVFIALKFSPMETTGGMASTTASL